MRFTEKLKNASKIVNSDIIFKLDIKNEINLDSDRDAFTGLIYNLVENAIKYTEEGKVVFGYYIDPTVNSSLIQFKIADEESNHKLVLFVEDTGIGIPEESQKVIFDPFRKVEKAKDKLYRGTGIGLALVKSLSEVLGGEVNLTSKINEGTKISVEIPISEF